MTTRRATALASAAAGLLVLAGLINFIATPTASFGWFAISPLSDQDFATVLSGAVLLSYSQVIAAVLVGGGLVLAAALGGYRLGQRARPGSE